MLEIESFDGVVEGKVDEPEKNGNVRIGHIM